MREYHVPRLLLAIVDLVHQPGKHFVFRSCGYLEQAMVDLIDYVGIDAKRSFEDAIMPVVEIKRKYGGRIPKIGGVNVNVRARLLEDEFRK